MAKQMELDPYVFARIRQIVVDILGIDAALVQPDTRFRDDLQADSLDILELIAAIAGEFDAAISDDDARNITTVGETVKVLSLAQTAA